MERGLCRTDIGPQNNMGWELSRAAADNGPDLKPLLVKLSDRI